MALIIINLIDMLEFPHSRIYIKFTYQLLDISLNHSASVSQPVINSGTLVLSV